MPLCFRVGHQLKGHYDTAFNAASGDFDSACCAGFACMQNTEAHVSTGRSDDCWRCWCRHWEERNRVAWSQQRLKELLAEGVPSAQLDESLGHAKIIGMKSCTGEVSACL